MRMRLLQRLLGSALACAVFLWAIGSARADTLYGATGSNGVNGELVILNQATGGVLQDIGP